MVFKIIKNYRTFYTLFGLVYATVKGENTIILIHVIPFIWESLNI